MLKKSNLVTIAAYTYVQVAIVRPPVAALDCGKASMANEHDLRRANDSIGASSNFSRQKP